MSFYETLFDRVGVKSVMADNQNRNAVVVLDNGQKFRINSNKFALQPGSSRHPPLQGGIAQPPADAGRTTASTSVDITKG